MRLSTLLLVTALGAPAFAAPPAPTPEAGMLLGAIDVMLTPAAIEKAGITEAWARAVVDDTKAPRYLRARALGALALIGTDTARARIERAAAEDTDVEVRIQATVSLARAFGPKDVAGVKAHLKRVAADAPKPLYEAVHRELTRLDKRTAAPR